MSGFAAQMSDHGQVLASILDRLDQLESSSGSYVSSGESRSERSFSEDDGLPEDEPDMSPGTRVSSSSEDKGLPANELGMVPGARVRLTRLLSRPELNGSRGMLVG